MLKNVLSVCLILVFMTLISLNESKSFLHSSSPLIKKELHKTSKVDERKPNSQKRISHSSLEKKKILSLRGGKSDSLDWRYFLAGSISAAFSHGITTPIDVIKTKMQTNPERFNRGVVSAAGDIIRTEGVSFLLSGLGPTVVGYGIEGALKFGFYETFKQIFETAKVTPYTFLNFLLASVIAGAIASVVLCPMEEARIKMVGDPSWGKENVVTAITRLLTEHGLFATFSGLPAMLSKQVPYTMGKNVSFDLIKHLLGAFATYLQINEADLKWIISIAGAFLSSIAACLLSQPGDMILTSSYKGKSGKTFGETISEIYKTHGLGGFYLGTQARLAHVASIITTQLVFYDFILSLLGIVASH